MKFKCLRFVLLALFSISLFADADTIVLKSGRKINTSWTKVEKDKVWYLFMGGKVAISRDRVAKVIKNDKVERRKSSRVITPSTTGTPVPTYTSSYPEQETKKDPKESVSYWTNEQSRLLQEKQRLEAELKELKKYRIAILNSRRSTKEINQKIADKTKKLEGVDKNLKGLLDRARRYGVRERDMRNAQKEGSESGEEG